VCIGKGEWSLDRASLPRLKFAKFSSLEKNYNMKGSSCGITHKEPRSKFAWENTSNRAGEGRQSIKSKKGGVMPSILFPGEGTGVKAGKNSPQREVPSMLFKMLCV